MMGLRRLAWGKPCGVLLAVVCLLLPVEAVSGAPPEGWQIVGERTAALRELPLLSPVPLEFVTPEQVLAERQAALASDQPRERLAVRQKLLTELGLLSPDQDLRRILGDQLGRTISGYYNTREKKMVIVSSDGNLGPRQEVSLAHEFTHAIQDQHFDLGALRRAAATNSDRSVGLLSLVEGDARRTDTEYARTYLSLENFSRVEAGRDCNRRAMPDGMPLVIRDSVLFAYCEGKLFVNRLIEVGGWAAVNRAYADPPVSSEQILHPDRYLDRQEPVEVSLPDWSPTLGEGWALLQTDVLGELYLRIIIQQYSDPGAAGTGAAGWGGDRYALLEHANGARLLVVRTIWDDPVEAREFVDIYLALLQRRFGASSPSGQVDSGPLILSAGGREISLLLADTRVEIVQAPDRLTLGAVLAALAAS